MKTDYIRARIEPNLKQEVHAFLHQIGITPTQIITMLYKQIKIKHRIPFDIDIPNAETAKAIQEAREGKDVVRCKDADDMLKRLGL
jgi:DNA-damage-inducible protein J